MSQKALHLLGHALLQQDRLEDAVAKIPNLEALREAIQPEEFILIEDPHGLSYALFSTL